MFHAYAPLSERELTAVVGGFSPLTPSTVLPQDMYGDTMTGWTGQRASTTL